MIWIENNHISIFFSLKSDGDMLFTRTDADLKRTDADKKNKKVRQNRISFFKKHNIDPKRLVNLAGIHGANIATFTRESILGSGSLDPDTRIPNTDGLITNIKNSYLMITGADCFPVMFWDDSKNVIGAAHCGWKGIIGADHRGLNADLRRPDADSRRQKSGIAIEMIKRFKRDFSSNPADINVWIGPGIKSCHYYIPQERAELFSKNYKNHIIERGNQLFLDLAGIIKSQLLENGIKPEKITEHPDCTFCEKDKWFSYRRDKLINPERVEGPEIIEANAFIIHLK
jgi:copper oxidase (laccase) domain-containing protein